jgi:hypothetical protein
MRTSQLFSLRSDRQHSQLAAGEGRLVWALGGLACGVRPTVTLSQSCLRHVGTSVHWAYAVKLLCEWNAKPAGRAGFVNPLSSWEDKPRLVYRSIRASLKCGYWASPSA